MKKNVPIKNISKSFGTDIRGRIDCVKLGRSDIQERFSSPISLNASIAILILSGTGIARINHKPIPIKENMILLLSALHLFRFEDCDENLSCLCLFVSKGFMDEMDSTDMIYKRIKYGVRLYNTPVVELEEEYTNLLSERIYNVDKSIDDTTHLYYKDVILNNLFAFYLDLSNIIDRRIKVEDDGRSAHYESIIKSLMELVIANYRTEHNVEFYASKLNFSAHYLTLIVKHVTGQSVSDFIFEMVYSEARNMLRYSKLSIQEITTSLNFSDQSSFGKFFKRKSGLSPIEYRKNKRQI